MTKKDPEPEKITSEIDSGNYQILFQNAPLGIFKASLGGRYLEVNRAMAEMLGYDGPEDLLMSVTNIAEQIYENPKIRSSVVRRLAKGKSVIKAETNFQTRSGLIFPVALTLSRIRDERSGQQFILGMVENISEKKGQHDRLIWERDYLRLLIDHLPDYIYMKDRDGQLTIVNEAFADLVNVLNPTELEGQPDIKEFTNELVVNMVRDDDEVLKSGRAVINAERSGYDDYHQSMLYTLYSKIPMKDSKGKVLGLIGIGRNITEIKLAEQRIIESQANLTAVIESAPNSIWAINRNYQLTTFNTHFKQNIKRFYNKPITAGDDIRNIFPPKERKNWKTAFKNAFNGKRWFTEDVLYREGSHYFFENSFNPILTGNGNVTGVTVYSNDITERRIAEEAIKESEQRFRQLAENSNDVFIITNDRNILYANPAFEIVFGKNVESVLKNNKIIEESIHPDDRESYSSLFAINQLRKSKGKGQHFRIIRSDGKIRRLWVRTYPIMDDSGKIYQQVLLISDITEQTELETTILDTKNQQQAILDNIPYLAWLKDKEGRYISVNEPFAAYYNMEVNELIGKTDYDICSPEYAEKYIKNDEEVKKTGKRQLVEEVKSTPEGPRWSETFKTPILDQNGNIIGITGIARDITDRKKMEEVILKNEEHIRSLIQNSSDAISILNGNGVITFESSAKNKISDFTMEELIGKPVFDIIHPDDKLNFRDFFNELVKKPGLQIKKEYRSLHKNKRWIYVESIFSNQVKNPSIKGIVVNSRDVSDRKMGELKERVYHDNLIFLSNSALDLLGLSERNDIYHYITEKLYHFLENAIILVSSYDENNNRFKIENIAGIGEYRDKIFDIIGRDPAGIIFPGDEEFSSIENAGNVVIVKDEDIMLNGTGLSHAMYTRLKELLNVHKVYNISLVRHNKLLGNITILTLNKSIIKFKHIIETFVHQVSVSLHRSQLEYELKTSKEKAEESDKLKTAFLANMSHEIRTPMNGILGFAEMLNDDSISSENKKKYLDVINSNGKMLISLIDDIIDFAKIEAGQIKILKQDFSLNKLLLQVHNSFLSETFKKEKSRVKLRIRKQFSDDNCYIRSDPNRLRQILTNLVGNAFKFTREGYIEIGYELRKDNYLEFFVKDTGIGIEEEKVNLIFERFIQADSSRTRKYGGSGLGLAISKGFAELLGGDMWLESEYGKGSVFYFSIPYVPVKKIESSEGRHKKTKEQYEWAGRTFLIAEDDKFSYKFLEGFLKQTKADVIQAEDGIQAIEICKKNKNIDLILMDIQMPELNGLEATIQIKEFNKSIPVIAQTANAIPEEREKCYEAGCDDFITKPVNISELFAMIDKWLGSKNK